jgi:hypothetical protein
MLLRESFVEAGNYEPQISGIFGSSHVAFVPTIKSWYMRRWVETVISYHVRNDDGKVLVSVMM